ncbi:response regulator [Algoriphagus boritolerans]|uniref:Response regulator receiver domain-containing protein n=1 Tax=Algoriphagus boritolerans DSM 17298 = JCM 18970 TaxID=1120964 RepID=A0A1H5VHG7_9BACT|nr:response regulator [Algoriphagus boritolerans]SEF86664.1 Response regulator receiver domain-containing protein [Algoriphagus boritolerans DSM 17298 = JCM 18970]
MKLELVLVDDDEVLLTILEKMFLKVRSDVKITLYNSGQKALDHLTNTHSVSGKRFLLVDIYLNDMSGWDLLDELTKRNDAASKVFILTSSVNPIHLETAKNYSQVIDFFEKPISFDKIHRIFELIEKE